MKTVIMLTMFMGTAGLSYSSHTPVLETQNEAPWTLVESKKSKLERLAKEAKQKEKRLTRFHYL